MQVNNLATTALNMQQYFQGYQVQTLLQRMQNNLALIDTPPNAQIITVVGGNLFQLASQYYGDQSQWALIAIANNLTDPMLVGLNTLLIPPLNNQDTGGLI